MTAYSHFKHQLSSSAPGIVTPYVKWGGQHHTLHGKVSSQCMSSQSSGHRGSPSCYSSHTPPPVCSTQWSTSPHCSVSLQDIPPKEANAAPTALQRALVTLEKNRASRTGEGYGEKSPQLFLIHWVSSSCQLMTRGSGHQQGPPWLTWCANH